MHTHKEKFISVDKIYNLLTNQYKSNSNMYKLAQGLDRQRY